MKKGVGTKPSTKKFSSASVAGTKAMIVRNQAIAGATHFSEERFKQAFDNLLEGCMVIGFDWTYLYVNNVAAESAQNKPQNLIGHTMLEMYPGVEKSQVFAHYQECMEKRILQRFEGMYTFANGEKRWYTFSVEPVPEGIFVLSMDITERKKAEEAARLGQEEFEQFFQNAPLYCYIVSPQGIIEKMNKAALAALEYSEKEIIDKPFTAIYVSEMLPKMRKLFELWKKEGAIHNEESIIQTKSGKKLDVVINVGAIRGPSGEILHSISIQQDVTQKKAELEKNAKLATYPILNPNPVVEINSSGKVEYVNPVAERLFPDLELRGFGHPFLIGIEQYLNKKQAVVTREVSVDGRSFQQNIAKIPESTIYRIYSADITERKQAEEKLREREIELKRAQRLGRIGNWTWNIATDTIFWSEEYYHIIGMDPKQSPPGYEEHLKAYTPESAARLDAAVKREMQTGEPYALDLEFASPKESAAKWITARSETITDDNGKIIGLRGTAQDITERKQAELEISRANRALRVVSGINQALIHATDEAALLNEACRIAVEVGGHRMAWIGFAENDEAKTVRPVARAGFDSGYVDSVNITWSDTERGRGPTGSAARLKKATAVREIATDPRMAPWRKAALEHGYLSSIALPLLNGNSSCLGVLTIYSGEPYVFGEKEMSILQELADDLAFGITTLRLRKKIEERTKEVDQLKNKFIQIVSHQLRTPLSVIRWNLEAVLDRERGEVVPAQVETLRGAYAANIEIISRLDDLLVAMDIDEGRVRLEMDTVDIGELLQSVCEEKLQPCQLKKITYEISSPANPLPIIRGDAVKIRDVVARLVDNAITYSNDGGHIGVKFFVANKKIRFEIGDTGVGIPTSEQPHIFERFHRGWNAALMKPDASGLSLFISKNYISAHHGAIGFTSTEKKGSTFWFELPIA